MSRGDEPRVGHPARQWLAVGLALLAAVPSFLVRLTHPALPHPLEALLFGLAIVGAAFLLSWAAEVAQLDISASLAIAVLALIAVLPEYAVDLVFAAKGGQAVEAYGAPCKAPGAPGESACSLALANMTGSNRLLIGVGWSLVVFIAWYRARQLRGRAAAAEGVQLERAHSVELAFLGVATLYSLAFLPWKRTVTPWDALVLVAIFVAYTVRIARAPAEEPELVGPARLLGALPTARRRVTVALLFVYAGVVILLSAEPFADSLVATGLAFGVSQFLLVQWLAPLASESPELLVAALYAWRLNTDAGLGTLVSSKVNQWTLLVGTLPVVFAITAGQLHGLPIEPRQREELLLTAAQSFFGLAVLANLSISAREGWMLFGLFWAQFVIGALVPEPVRGIERLVVSALYLALGLVIFLRDRRRLPGLLRDGLLASHEQLRERAREPQVSPGSAPRTTDGGV